MTAMICLLFLVALAFELSALGLKAGDSCVTPNQENATCSILKDCAILLDAYLSLDPRLIQFVQESRCDSKFGSLTSNILVCCGSLDQPNKNYKPILPTQTNETVLSEISDKTVCGLDSQLNRIVGGNVANFDEFPWMAALEYKSGLTNEVVGIRCGGSLITDQYVLTAAHCIVHIEFVIIKAWLGATNISSNGNCLNLTQYECINSIQKLDVRKQIPHGGYNRSETYNDIGILQLAHRVKFTHYIRPICLPSPYSPLPISGTFLTVAGWGETEERKLSEVKLKVEVPLLNESICDAYLIKDQTTVITGQLCAGDRAKDSCQGDSGGPLMKAFRNADRKTQWYQEGVVSYGVGCGVIGHPGIYSKVSQYVPWIIRKINDLHLADLKKGDHCVTPNQENGTCIPFILCDVIVGAVATFDSTAIKFREESRCGPEFELVCCGSEGYPNKKTYRPKPVINGIPLPHREKTTLDFSCGIQVTPPLRINGGTVAVFEEFPWLAVLKYISKLDKRSVRVRCGGSLINDRYILTAAHCLVHVEFMVVEAWLGANNITSEKNCVNLTGRIECPNSIRKVNIAKEIPHPLYRRLDSVNDIGLLRLAEKISFTDYIHPICLPSPGMHSLNAGIYLTVAGWGTTENHKQSEVKLKVDLPLQNNSVCNKLLARLNIILNSAQLCVGGEEGKDACKGDSGGPLMRKHINGNGTIQWYQDGIVSYGVGCGHNGRPGVYTKVSAYVAWIVSNLDEL